jgi:hypothetical protein
MRRLSTLLAACNTFHCLQKYPTVVSGETSPLLCDDWFIFSLSSLSLLHQPRVKKCLNFLYHFNCGPYFFLLFCIYFKLFLWFIYFFNFILYHFIFMSDSVLFFLIDIYFVFHPSFNWFFFSISYMIFAF